MLYCYCYYLLLLWLMSWIYLSVAVFSRDVTEPANIHAVECGFHVQNPSDSDADADLSCDQNYQLLKLL